MGIANIKKTWFNKLKRPDGLFKILTHNSTPIESWREINQLVGLLK